VAFDTAATLVPALEQAFGCAQQRMADLPFLNDALRVRAVGFVPWQQYWLGVMITPWFMNLMAIPRDTGEKPLPVGSTQTLVFPAGEFAFTAGYDDELGTYLSCSLMSPVKELANQELAEQVALASLQALFGVDQEPEPASVEAEPEPPRRAFFRRMAGQAT